MIAQARSKARIAGITIKVSTELDPVPARALLRGYCTFYAFIKLIEQRDWGSTESV